MKYELAIDDPAVAEFVRQCGITDMDPEGQIHKVAIELLCVNLDDLGSRQAQLEQAFGNGISFGRATQTGRGWRVKGSIG